MRQIPEWVSKFHANENNRSGIWQLPDISNWNQMFYAKFDT